MKASILNIIAILAIAPATLALPTSEASDTAVSARTCVRDTVPHARDADPANLFERACRDYLCSKKADCTARGCVDCIYAFDECGNSIARCR
ncbi:hypothetical protein BR93DRAFT_964404 [Coniochaeta sp. PMI_546]|nr:hypothetical protein BR93DRAFT_964404 [Coniochaeta sp. PMI_546]